MNLLGKCKTCDYTIFATGEDVQVAEHPSDVQAGRGVFRLNNGYVARCVNRHKFFACKAIKGTYSEKHQCDSRCLNAKGWTCTCSCGGANHGRGHAVTIVNAAELRPSGERISEGTVGIDPKARAIISESVKAQAEARTAGKHLGEVGKHIRGEVKIARVIEGGGHVDYTTYRFITEAGDTIIWFVPVRHDPQWPEGKTLTIRAKVKRHESHERFGNSTVVIYVEEVE